MTTVVDGPQGAHWSFRLGGIPVRVDLWFWIAMLIMGANRSLAGALIWVGVCFVSILLHELGHVLAFRRFGRKAEVVLYAFGGMAIPERDVIGTRPKVLVALAGPIAGFCLAGFVVLANARTGGQVWFIWHKFVPYLGATLSEQVLVTTRNVWFYSYGSTFLSDLLYVNFYWGLVNLLPVWPLDGGHVSRALFEQWDHFDGLRKSLIVSALTAAAIALSALSNHRIWLAVMFGMLSVSSFQALAGQQRRPILPYRRWRDSR